VPPDLTKEHTMQTLRRIRFFAIVAAAGVAGVVASQATAHSGAMKVKGTFDTQTFTGPRCAAPTGQCFEGTFRGSFRGPVDGSLTSVTPTQQPGVVLIDVSSTIHTPRGDLISDHQQIVSDTSPSGRGEFSVLSEISGGTGRYAGATGYLQGVGTMSPSGHSTGAYVGEIKLRDGGGQRGRMRSVAGGGRR
jgi:hypothetical protein